MHRREFLAGGLAAALCAQPAWAAETWGADQGYPTGWGGEFSRWPAYRVGNYSGGFEQMFPVHRIAPAERSIPWEETPLRDFRYRWGFSQKTPEQYLDQWPATGLLIARDGHILHESYRHARTAQMRLTSWSMAKSVTSLLLGICLDQRLIESYDDPAERYVPELAGTLHGGISLRHLSNMSSGAQILHDRDNAQIYPSAFTGRGTSIRRTVARWNWRREDPGRTYNYNELCPLTLGMVIRQVTGQSMAAFAERVLWQPMGAESQATWTTDFEGNEFNCIGFAATLRDWARLGRLVAQRGQMNGVQVVSEAWIRECTRWTERDQQVRHGVASPYFGYKAHMWHNQPDGSRLYFNGHHGQRVIIDLPTRTVLAHTAVDHQGNWQAELFSMFEAATRL